MIKNFDKLPFERKIDVFVAEHVFKYEGIKIEEYTDKDLKHLYWGVSRVDGHWDTNILCYSTLLTSAWDIVRKFKFVYLYKSEFINGRWECILKDEGFKDSAIMAETEMLAICYAGLKVVGFNIEGFLKEEGK